MNSRRKAVFERYVAMTASASVLLASLVVSSASASAVYQQARPLAESDGYIPFYGSRFRIFREAGKSDIDKETRIFYEPLVLPVTDESGHLRHVISADEERLTLLIQVDPDRRVPKLIKRYLVENKKIDSGGFRQGNIAPLPITEGWLETSDEKLKSIPYKKGALAISGVLTVHFELDVNADPAKVVSELEAGHLQLLFRYTFTGEAVSNCRAMADWTNLLNLNRVRELEGDGGKSYVTRNQLAAISGEVGEHIVVNTACMREDVEARNELKRDVLDLLKENGNLQNLTIDDLGKYSSFTPEIFKADVVTQIKEIQNKETREQIQSVFEDIYATSISGGFGMKFFIKAIPVALNARAEISVADKELTKRLADTLQRAGYSFSFDGKKYTFRNLEIFSNEKLLDRLKKGIELTHQSSSLDSVTYTVPITRNSWRYLPEIQPCEKLCEVFGREFSADNKSDVNGLTDFHFAVLNKELLQKLLWEEGPYGVSNPSVMRDGQPFAGPDIEKLHTSFGLDLSEHDRIGQTVGHMAVLLNTVDSMRVLLEHIDGIFTAKDKNGDTVLHYAAKYGTVDMMDVLVGKATPEEIDEPNNTKQSAIHYAVKANSAQGVRTLVCNGGRVDVQDRNGYTPLHLASLRATAEIMKSLIDISDDTCASGAGEFKEFIDKKDGLGRTALQIAVQKDAVDIARVLIDGGADRLADKGGTSPFFEAMRKGNPEMIALFLKSRS